MGMWPDVEGLDGEHQRRQAEEKQELKWCFKPMEFLLLHIQSGISLAFENLTSTFQNLTAIHKPVHTH